MRSGWLGQARGCTPRTGGSTPPVVLRPPRLQTTHIRKSRNSTNLLHCSSPPLSLHSSPLPALPRSPVLSPPLRSEAPNTPAHPSASFLPPTHSPRSMPRQPSPRRPIPPRSLEQAFLTLMSSNWCPAAREGGKVGDCLSRLGASGPGRGRAWFGRSEGWWGAASYGVRVVDPVVS